MSSLHCRATLLLQKELFKLKQSLFKLKQSSIWGISIDTKYDAEDDESHLYSWNITMSGLKSTSWQDAVLKLRMEFDQDFNISSPRIYFIGVIPFHPNVSASDGKVCLACLDEWVPSRFSIANILLSLQQLLSEPCFSEEAWNETAVQVAKETPKQYVQIVLDTVMKSQRIDDDGQSPNETPTSPKPTAEPPQLPHYKLLGAQIHSHYNTTPTPPNTTANNKNSSEKLSYENYLDGWKRLGTTGETSMKDTADSVVFEGLLEGEIDFVDDPSLNDTVTEEIYHQLSEHRKITYGSFKSTTDEEKTRKRAELLRANKVQLLKDIHSNKKTLKSLKVSLPASPVNNSPTGEFYDEESQIEAQELVKWSQALP